jgi:lipoyl(octanoyl) transferase
MAKPLQSNVPAGQLLAAAVAQAPLPSIQWTMTPAPVPYETACRIMAERVASIASGSAPELVWLLEHSPLYTAGTSAKPEDLVAPTLLPVHRSGRGGQYTYHGPGQRVAYVMLDVKRRFGDVRAYVAALEGWLIDTLAALDVQGERWPGRVGVWVRPGMARRPADVRTDIASGVRAAGMEPPAKIAAIGVRLTRWVSSHGIALNVAPDLAHYAGIVPCGIRDAGVTSLAALGRSVSLDQVDSALRAAFERRFGATAIGPAPAGTGNNLGDPLKAPV